MVGNKTFRLFHRVTYAECTLGNHVYHARYLDILETVRGAFFHQLGQSFLAWQEKDRIFPIIDCRLRYKHPAHYDDVISVELCVGLLEKVQLAFDYRLFNAEGRLLVEAMTHHVCTNVKSKPKRLPEGLASALAPYYRQSNATAGSA